MKLKITLNENKTIILQDIQSCEEIIEWDNRNIDYKYYDEEDQEFRYFNIIIRNENKTLAISGNVELLDVLIQENSIEIWDKKIKLS